jgi:lysozyme
VPRARGIDVSHWQPVRDWSAVHGSGVTFVGIKATEGSGYVDPMLRAHREGFRQFPFGLGILYHFGRSGGPVQQAERFLDACGRLRDHERLALDLEVSVMPHPPDTLAWLDAFFNVLDLAYSDRRHIIYTSDRIWRSIGNPAWDRDVDLWAPRYGTEEPVLPKPWAERGWTFWQDRDNFTCPGVEGPCDGNVFRSDALELHRYAELL